MIGQVFDERYRIVRKLGEGGTGEVYLAEHVTLGRQDALKILHPRLAGDAEFVARFRREARATNRLHHPNIVAVHDFGKLGDKFYLAMELVSGERLDSVVRRSTLPVPRVLRILAQLADAVDHAHSRGVVHRDLKPENLQLVEHRGRADILKVLDFGIAKIVSGEAVESVKLSHSGKIYGTPTYMAPEQFSGGVADPRVDLYAIGCIAYTLLTGGPPFTGHMLQLLEQHATRHAERPSARRQAGGAIPPELDELVLRCLAKSASERFQTGRDLFMALERLQERQQRSPSGRRTSYSLGIAAARTGVHDTLGATQLGTAPLSAGVTQPMSISDEVAARASYETVRALAQMLAELHESDARLFVTLQRLKQLDDELAHCDAQQQALEALSDDFEEASRAREASLRFALGEVCYERSHALARGETPDALLDREILRLEGRVEQLAAELEAELTPLVDHAISLAARRATSEENAVALHATLEALVDELLPRFAAQPQVAPLANRLRSIRASIPSRGSR